MLSRPWFDKVLVIKVPADRLASDAMTPVFCFRRNGKNGPLGYPQSNGRIERWCKMLKGECIRTATALSWEDARHSVAEFVSYDNTVRLHSATASITPVDKMAGRAEAIRVARREKLARAEARRRAKAQVEGFAQSRPAELL
jgi:hypothetical protein